MSFLPVPPIIYLAPLLSHTNRAVGHWPIPAPLCSWAPPSVSLRVLLPPLPAPRGGLRQAAAGVEKERSATASVAEQAMSKITSVQKDKWALEIEARQQRRRGRGRAALGHRARAGHRRARGHDKRRPSPAAGSKPHGSWRGCHLWLRERAGKADHPCGRTRCGRAGAEPRRAEAVFGRSLRAAPRWFAGCWSANRRRQQAAKPWKTRGGAHLGRVHRGERERTSGRGHE